MNNKKEKQMCKYYDEEVCSRLNCKKDCKFYGKANCLTCIHEEVCQLRTFSYREEVKEKGCKHYQPKLPKVGKAKTLYNTGCRILKQGKWLVTEQGRVITCSNCNKEIELYYPDGTEVGPALTYCPYCGSKNREN